MTDKSETGPQNQEPTLFESMLPEYREGLLRQTLKAIWILRKTYFEEESSADNNQVKKTAEFVSGKYPEALSVFPLQASILEGLYLGSRIVKYMDSSISVLDSPDEIFSIYIKNGSLSYMDLEIDVNDFLGNRKIIDTLLVDLTDLMYENPGDKAVEIGLVRVIAGLTIKRGESVLQSGFDQFKTEIDDPGAFT